MTTLAARRAGAQHQLRDLQDLLDRVPATLAGLAKIEADPADRDRLKRMHARAVWARDHLATIGRVPGLPEVKPVEPRGGVDE